MDRIRAPYNFVPLSPRVVFPDWSEVPAQDVPFADGVCGSLTIELRTMTPLFIRGNAADNFFSLAGSTAIPGSELRGLLRNVVEIASFGKLGRFNDHRYGLRDLNNRELYVGHMADLMVPPGGNQKQPIPLVDAGWLQRVGEGQGDVVAEITPCNFAKIHYRDLEELAQRRGARAFQPGRKQSAPEKYKAWGAMSGEEDMRRITVDVIPLRPNDTRFLSRFGKARPGGKQAGLLVFTGQPQRWDANDPRSRAKRNDFVFYEPSEKHKAIPVNKSVFEDFEFIHADRGQQGRMVDGGMAPNDEWRFWREVFNRGGRVPVFFLRWPAESTAGKPGELRAFGLAMMFRLAYDYSVGRGVRNAQPQANALRLDLADVIFGNVLKPREGDNSDKTIARRGRVSFGLFRSNAPVILDKPVVDLVLGSPKTSYYPNYIEQGAGSGDAPPMENEKPRYMTFMNPDFRVRGWKRYRPHAVVRMARRPTRADGSEFDLARVETRFTPVRAGTTFLGQVRVHNLRRIELGAILWALDFGGREDCFHTLGLARSHGYGRVQLKVLQSDLDTNAGGELNLDMCRAEFEAWMDSQLSDLPGMWQDSVQVADLLALARPIPEGSDEGRHMELRHPLNRNEFQQAKVEGLALPPVNRPQARAFSTGAPASRSADISRSAGMPRRTGTPSTISGGHARSSSNNNNVVQPVGSQPRAWSGIAGGTRVKARLVGLSRKGKWQVELVDHAARGVVGAGAPPAGADVGAILEVIVTGGGDPTNLVLKWP